MAHYNKKLLAVGILSLSLLFPAGCTPRESEPVEETNSAKVDISPVITDAPIINSDPIESSPDIEQPSPSPEVFSPELEEMPAVEDEFFADAAFLGNSLVDGFRLFSGLTTCDYYAATSLTVSGASSQISLMAQKQYEKIYILLGINEIGYDVDYFKSLYSDMLDTIMTQQPEADIYIMSLTPVSAYKSSTSDTFNMDRIGSYNDALLELATEKECFYLDLCTALAGDDGFLPSTVTSDGVHFSADHYKVWFEYVRTHYAEV